MSEGVAEKLMTEVSAVKEIPHGKVSVVGVGQVGMACAFSMMVQVRAQLLILVYNLYFLKHLLEIVSFVEHVRVSQKIFSNF